MKVYMFTNKLTDMKALYELKNSRKACFCQKTK